MKISPVTGPGAVQDKSTPESVRTARAIQAFQNAAKPAPTQGNAQETLVADPNNVSAEELSALNVSTQAPESTDESDVNTVDEATVEPKEEKKEDPALSRQFAQLARQERALRAKAQQQDQSYKAREAALDAREKALGEKPTFDPKDYISRSRLQQDALGVLEAEGISNYEQLTERAVSRVPVDPILNETIQALKAQIEELKGSVSKSSEDYQAQQQAQYQTALKQIETEARALVRANPEEFEAIAKTGTIRQVVKLIEDTYNKDGVLMSVEEAAQEVENYLVDENFKMSTSIQKIQKRMDAANASRQQSDVKTQANNKQTQGMKTLTNSASSSRQLSSKERAILAFKGELKS